MSTREETIKRLAHDLIGSGDVFDLEVYMEEQTDGEIDNLTLKEFEIVDEIVFKCACCAWWCDKGEVQTSSNDEWVCTDCFNDEQGEEE